MLPQKEINVIKRKRGLKLKSTY